MGADNTTSDRHPFEIDDGDPIGPSPGEFSRVPEIDRSPPDLSPTTTPQTSFSRKVKTKAPASVLVCLDCETYYPDGDGWDYCPNCGAHVFKVSKD